MRKPKTPEYCAWSQAKARCNDVNHQAYKWYGARGIRMCRQWQDSFQSFLADMGPRPTGGKYTLERRDNQKGYQPDNCYWATFIHQANNRRGNVILTWKDQTMTLANWCRVTGLKYGVAYQRLAQGWTVEEAFSTPHKQRRGHHSPPA